MICSELERLEEEGHALLAALRRCVRIAMQISEVVQTIQDTTITPAHDPVSESTGDGGTP